jgi:hypothetical protein
LRARSSVARNPETDARKIGLLLPLSYPYAVCQPLKSVTPNLSWSATARASDASWTPSKRSLSRLMLQIPAPAVSASPAIATVTAVTSFARIVTGSPPWQRLPR